MRRHRPTSALESDLPLVRQGLPGPVRIALVAGGIAAIVLPIWDWWHFLRQPVVMSAFLWLFVCLVAGVGVRLVGAGLSGWREHWRYPEGGLEVHRRAWRRDTVIRLSAANVAGVEVRHSEEADVEAAWYVIVVPKPTCSGLAATAGAAGVFQAGSFASQADAERVRHALSAHLRL